MSANENVERASRPFVDQSGGNGRDARSTRRPYFRSPERITALRQQLQQWAGTRWAHAGARPNAMRCGVTGDCLFWVHAFKAIGALPAKVTIPDYRKMEAAGDGMKMLRECIEGTGVAERVWSVGTRCAASDDDRPRSSAALPSRTVCEDVMMPMPMVGDVFLFRNGQSGCHCGMCVKPFPPHFVHLSRNGFLEEPMNQKHWTDALAFVYRLVEESDQRSAVSGQPEADSREPNADSRAPEVRA